MLLTDRVQQSFKNSKYASIIACVFTFLLALSLLPTQSYADTRNSDVVMGITAEARGLTASQCPNISAQYAYVVSDDGTVYFERDAHAKTKIASVTKIMTALVALEYGDPASTTITVSERAAHVGESTAGLQQGDTMTLETALKGLLIPSGNDAGQAIAESMGADVYQQLKERYPDDENIPTEPYDAFIYAMNKKAAELGMNDSTFVNPHGLDMDEWKSEEMGSSAYDCYLMTQEAMKNDLFRSIVSTHETTIQVTRGGQPANIDLLSTDELLVSYEGACGVKTGNTDYAGACFSAAVERDGKTYYAMVLHCDNEAQRFIDTQTLYNWVFNNTIDYPLAHSPETVNATIDGTTQDYPVIAYVSNRSWIDKTFKATIADPGQTVSVFVLNGNVSQDIQIDEVSGNVSAGQKVGTINFMQHNEVIASVDLVAAEDFAGPNFFEGIGIWWDRLMRGFNGQPQYADNTIVNTTPIIFGADASFDEV